MQCSKCGEQKDLEKFSWKVKDKRRRTWCKACDAKWRRDKYASDPDFRRKVIDSARANIEKRVARCREVLKASGCVDCGNSDIRVLEFDHLPEFEKVAAVMWMARNSRPIEDIEAEMAKCEVRCGNCHKIKTYERGGWKF